MVSSQAVTFVSHIKKVAAKTDKKHNSQELQKVYQYEKVNIIYGYSLSTVVQSYMDN